MNPQPSALTPREEEFLTGTLRNPATMALCHLERCNQRPDMLRRAYDLESAGKCRWQVLNQLKLWQKQLPAAPPVSAH